MLNECPIPQKLLDIIARELEPGERTEWVGMPIPRFFTPASTATFIFGIPWTAFAIFWTVSAGGESGEGFGIFSLFALFGIPFILIGFAMLLTPLWTYRKALKTVYAITDRRAVTFDGGISMTIRSYPPDQLQNLYRKEKSDGTGDIVISRRAWRDSDGDNRSEELGFLRIRDPKMVEGLLKKLAGTIGKQNN
jgi:hypothetical protein